MSEGAPALGSSHGRLSGCATLRPAGSGCRRTADDQPDLRDELARRGFTAVETVDVLALAIGPGHALPDLDVPSDVAVVPVDDEAAPRLGGDIDAVVFGWAPPSEALVADTLAQLQADRAAGRWTMRSFLAHLRGEGPARGRPVGHAGCTFANDVVRLWGGCVLPLR